MISIHERNVNGAYCSAMHMFQGEDVTAYPSRNGPMLEAIVPVTTTYEAPLERVLFDPTRDCNPFLHFFESLWMLAGRNDLAFMTQFAPGFKNFSDDGETLHGAYGHRWRVHFTRQNERMTGSPTSGSWRHVDQIVELVSELARDPMSRRVVTQMWDPRVDLGVDGKDLPCNTAIFWRLRRNRLDMTVTNRSNDAIWGCYGANVVHFSFLQEYVASCLGVEVGQYHQMSNSLHIYPELAVTKRITSGELPQFGQDCPYEAGNVRPYPLFHGGATQVDWDTDLMGWFYLWETCEAVLSDGVVWQTDYFNQVVNPMWGAFRAWKDKTVELALNEPVNIEASDWRLAVTEFLQRRIGTTS